MTLPGFLVIGAMKSGTTTVYRDLSAQPRIFAPVDKEPEALLSDEVFTPQGLARYERLFRKARADQLCFEASTGYTKLPDLCGAAERAARLRDEFGGPGKAVYVVRNPVKRLISQHYHEYSAGEMGPDIERAVREHPKLINYSKYTMQVGPWIEALGRENVKIVLFEQYMADRDGGLFELCGFLGVEFDPASLDMESRANRSEGKAVHNRLSRWMAANPVYRKLVREALSDGLRDKLRGLVSSKAPPRPGPPSEETVALIERAVWADAEKLGELLGLPGSPWSRSSALEGQGREVAGGSAGMA